MGIKELREKLGKLEAEIKRQGDILTADGHAETAEERSAWDKANADYNATRKLFVDAQRLAEVAAFAESRGKPADEKPAKPGREDSTTQRPALANGEETRTLAFNGWLAYQLGRDVSPEQRAAAESLNFNLNRKELGFDLRPISRRMARPKSESDIVSAAGRESRAQSAVIGQDGGYLVPSTLVNAFELAMLWFGGMEDAEEIVTASGEEMQWPGANDTGNTGAQVGENTAVSTTDFAVSRDRWGAYKFTSNMVLVPQELLEDSAQDVPAIVGKMLGERIGRIRNTKCTTGTGAATVNGIATASTAAFTSAAATAITADELIKLHYSVDKSYRDNGKWMLHDDIAQYLRKLKDGDGQYLWATLPGLAGSQPDTLLGKPVVINNDMSGATSYLPTTATKSVLFGDLSKYKIRTVRGVRFYRLTERYRDSDQDGFVAFLRFDGNLLNSGGNPVKHILQA